MKCSWILSLAATSCLCLTGSSLHADDCGAIKNLKLADTTIIMAETIDSATLEIPGQPKPFKSLPPFCRVKGLIQPTTDSVIHFEVWLPAKQWNRRFLGVGNGGFAGEIGYQNLAGYLARGYATAGSDAGHTGQSLDASWAFGHPEKIRDFGWRAVHLTAERGKDIVNAYYGKHADKAYFDACSDGGREALMEAERFPEDYDGILAGAPANAWTQLLSSGVDVAQVTAGDPRAYISALKLPAIQRASLAACDAADGVKDGFLNDPSKCHFDPQALLCKGPDSIDCLTQPQADSLKKYYSGGRKKDGASILPGYAMGDEESWKEWVVGQGPLLGLGADFVQNYFRYMVSGDVKWNVLTANVDESLQQATRTTAADLDSTNPDLRKFAGRGGKLILYHGWNDPAISPWNTIHYYQSVQKTIGEPETDSFLRLYMVPGMEHCAGGPGPSAFGQLGIPTTGEPKFGVFDALVGWVEKGTPAGTVIATKYSAGGDTAVMTRPLCPYPAIAKYNGAGDTNDAGSFACSKE